MERIAPPHTHPAFRKRVVEVRTKFAYVWMMMMMILNIGVMGCHMYLY